MLGHYSEHSMIALAAYQIYITQGSALYQKGISSSWGADPSGD